MSNTLADGLPFEMEIEVFYPRVLVELFKAPEKTKGGVYIAEATRKFHAPPRGVVRAVGKAECDTGESHEPLIAVGDVIQFNKMSGTEFEQGDSIYRMITLKDIQMRITTKEV